MIDRVNPVLVKEVRQAVRGKFFRSSFIGMLMLAAVVAAVVLSNLELDDPGSLASSGSMLFFALLVVMIISAFLALPQQANRSMISEREGGTYDALLISGLSPAQIVLGKWLSSGLLLLLFLSALMPFIATSVTLYGLDIPLAFATILMTLVLSMGLSMIGILFACLSTQKAGAAVLQGVFALICFGMLWAWLGMSAAVFLNGEEFFPDLTTLLQALGVAIVAATMLYAWLYGLTVASLTHPEDNVLLRVRWACLGSSLFLAGFSVFIWTQLGGFGGALLAMTTTISVFIVSFLNVPLVTESNRIGRRTQYQVAGKRKGLLGSSLFLPGGNSGYMLYLLQLFILLLPMLAVAILAPSSLASTSGIFGSSRMPEFVNGMFTSTLVCMACLSLPGLWASSIKSSRRTRTTMRVLIPILPGLLSLTAGMIGLLIGGDERGFESAFSPIYVIAESFDETEPNRLTLLWAFLAFCGTVPHFFGWLKRRTELRKIREQGRLLDE